MKAQVMKAWGMMTLLGLLLVVKAAAQQVHFVPDELVVGVSSIHLRAEPNVGAERVGTAPRGAILRVEEAFNQGEPEVVDDRVAPWYKVRFQQQTGYVFGAYVSPTYRILFEDHFLAESDILPALNWYGVYPRDSSADELRLISVRLELEEDEIFGPVRMIRTNQTDTSKLIIGSLRPLRTGYAGPLGYASVADVFPSDLMSLGNTMAIYAGQEDEEAPEKPVWHIATIGCATMDIWGAMHFEDMRIRLMDYSHAPPRTQDLSGWFMPSEVRLFNPKASLLWFGDLDGDDLPDFVTQDCPDDMGCRASLFLSGSTLHKDEFVRKTAEFFFPFY